MKKISNSEKLKAKFVADCVRDIENRDRSINAVVCGCGCTFVSDLKRLELCLKEICEDKIVGYIGEMLQGKLVYYDDEQKNNI